VTVDRGVKVGAAVFLAVMVVGTAGYVVIEDVSWFSAFYMVVVTVSTVGFEEVFPLSPAGQAFTIGLMVLGIGAALYTIGSILEVALENLGSRRSSRIVRQIASLTEHHIVCGFGKVGATTWNILARRGTEVVVVEKDPELAEAARREGALVIEGDATHNDVLESAGLMRARALVACVRDDADNLVIVLSAKALRPELLVISRATEPEWGQKLLLAGADRVVAPQLVGARRLAAMSLDPGLSEFVDLMVEGDLVELRLEQFHLPPESRLAGLTLRDSKIREQAGATILAVSGSDHHLRLNPDSNVLLEPGNVLIAIGTASQITALKELIEGRVLPEVVDESAESG
jgi:voltage-gated potassium channel